MAVDPSSIRVDYTRDSLFEDFSLTTLRERYQTEGEASPQDAFARACAAFADDEAHAQRLYDAVSRHWFMFATPLLANGGLERGLPISCFLNLAEDSRQGIFDHWAETGWLSSAGGGIGGCWSDLRSDGERTSKGSKSTGLIPFVSAVDRIILSVSQGGTRRGSYAAYLDIDHPEIEEFITIRKPDGGDANRKALNLHNAVNVSDAFMVAVRDDLDFDLKSPKTGEVVKTVSARRLWHLILETRKATGEPYLHFIDTTNRALPEPQKAKGLKVRQSNLCVSGATQIATRRGYLPIEGLAGQKVEVWNGKAFSEVEIVQTAERAELVRVWFSDGDYLDCTPYHKFYTDLGDEVRAGELVEGMALEQGQAGSIASFADDTGGVSVGAERAYSAGYATFAGFEDENRLSLMVSASDNEELKRHLFKPSVDISEVDMLGDYKVRYDPKTLDGVGYPPLHWSKLARARWLGGALDAAGSAMSLEGVTYLTVASEDRDLIRAMKLLCHSVNLTAEVRLTDTIDVLMVRASDVHKMHNRFFFRHANTMAGQESAGRADAEIVVVDVHPLPHKAATYCATEPKRGRLTFNGYVTGNCSEITLPTGRDYNGKMRTAVCCLSSLNAAKFDEWKESETFIEDFFRMLDNALSDFIERAEPGMGNAAYSAMMERSVGAGMLGFHTALQQRRIPFESQEARAFNKTLFSHFRAKADEASLKLGAERGEAPDMEGTGHRFAHRIAVAPNASSSILAGGISPSIEPINANTFLHKTLSGSFPVRNKQLQADLAELGLDTAEVWKSIVQAEGSIQHLDLPEHLKKLYRKANEIDQRWVVLHAAERTPYIDQAQSVNLFFEDSAPTDYINETHFMAWGRGLKTLYYYRSTRARAAENTNTKVDRAKVDVGEIDNKSIADLVDEGPVGPESDCLACEG